MNSAFAFTVLTPTYNRAKTLPRVYQTLLNQDFGDFEWLIVDDGSTDGTDQLVADWIAEKRLQIRYIWQSNQHKKTAVNTGVREAAGSLVVILDSDDELLPGALNAMQEIWYQIPDELRHSYIGVTGLCVDEEGKVVGDRFPHDLEDMTSIDMYFRHRPAGEKFGCLNKNVLGQYPYPENIKGYVPESLIWRKIARQGYLTRFVNQPFRVYHRSDDSLSAGGVQNPAAFATGSLLIARDTVVECKRWFFSRPSEFIKSAVRYTRFRRHLGKQPSRLPEPLRLKGSFAHLLVLMMYPLGYLCYRRDVRQHERLPDKNGAVTG